MNTANNSSAPQRTARLEIPIAQIKNGARAEIEALSIYRQVVRKQLQVLQRSSTATHHVFIVGLAESAA